MFNCSVSVSETFSSPNCSNFAIECDWISKIPQNVRNFGLFKRLMFFSQKKLEFFFQNFATEYVSNDNISSICFFFTWFEGFVAKIRKKINLQNCQICWKLYFLKRDTSKRYRGWKICRWWPAVLFYFICILLLYVYISQ